MENIFGKALLLILKAMFGVIAFILFYLFASIILSLIPCNTKFGSTADGVEIYILTNGIHTDMVLPAKNEFKDWTKEIEFKNAISNDPNVNFMAFGWGDRGFYLETKTSGDLKFSIISKAMFALGKSAMHITNYRYLKVDSTCKKISISKGEYERLVKYIEDSFMKNTSGKLSWIKDHCYGENDSFYEAKGSYSLFKTCNTWANEGLKMSGIRCCLWTPFDKGIFYQYKDL